MTANRLEVLARDLAERCIRREPTEDGRVELKAEWPDPRKAARQLAGHANAARGEPIIWLIGIDETRACVPGVLARQLNDWLPQVESCFDSGVAPRLLRDVNVTVGSGTVVALYFETERAPYVFRKSAEAAEVLWREGTRLRFASRTELLKLLIPFQSLPDIELLTAEVCVSTLRGVDAPKTEHTVSLHATVYVTPVTSGTLVFPFHRCLATIEIAGAEFDLSDFTLGPQQILHDYDGVSLRSASRTVAATPTEALLSGPGLAVVSADATINVKAAASLSRHSASLRLRMRPAGVDRAVVLDTELASAPPGAHEIARWSLSDNGSHAL
jgi:hypothetical protein